MRLDILCESSAGQKIHILLGRKFILNIKPDFLRKIKVKIKDIRPHIFLLNFKFLTKNYIIDIIMIFSEVLLSANYLFCDGHWK